MNDKELTDIRIEALNKILQYFKLKYKDIENPHIEILYILCELECIFIVASCDDELAEEFLNKSAVIKRVMIKEGREDLKRLSETFYKGID